MTALFTAPPAFYRTAHLQLASLFASVAAECSDRTARMSFTRASAAHAGASLGFAELDTTALSAGERGAFLSRILLRYGRPRDSAEREQLARYAVSLLTAVVSRDLNVVRDAAHRRLLSESLAALRSASASATVPQGADRARIGGRPGRYPAHVCPRTLPRRAA